MNKLKRNERLIDLTQQFLNKPFTLISLNYFSKRYQAAKSSISEDIDIINELFMNEGIGELVSIVGATGGIKYVPNISRQEAIETIESISKELSNGERLLLGQFLYMVDILGNPLWVKQIGRIFASEFIKEDIDAIVTIETKGIPLAYSTASFLNVPVLVVSKNSKIAEGSVVTINYISGSTGRIQTMSLAKRSLKTNANVLIIDDLMKAGGTINGVINLLKEFNANIKGIGVFIEVDGVEEKLFNQYVSLLRLIEVNEKEKRVKVELGNYFENR
ncbi:MAG: pur operon repressor [Vulcanibacillus sp.]